MDIKEIKNISSINNIQRNSDQNKFYSAYNKNKFIKEKLNDAFVGFDPSLNSKQKHSYTFLECLSNLDLEQSFRWQDIESEGCKING